MEAEKFSLQGKIVKMVTSDNVKVELVNKKVIDCYISKKLRRYSAYFLEGDLVLVELDIYDLNKGKIIDRLKAEEIPES